jgi:hypothetical protein
MLSNIPVSSATGSLWLNCESDVVAHLFFAAAEIETVKIQIGGEEVEGKLSFPRTETRRVVLTIDERTQVVPFQPLPGAVVRVSYFRGPSKYEWLSSVVEAADKQHWVLGYPALIQRSERRIVERHRVLGRGGFQLRVDMGDGDPRALPLFDLSAAGIGFMCRAGSEDLYEGAELDAVLTLPDGSTVTLCIEVANTRPIAGGTGDHVVGCRLLGVPAAVQARIARALAEYGREHA